MRLRIVLVPGLALALALTGCADEPDDEQVLARDGCDLLQRAVDAEPEELFEGQLAEDFEDFAERVEEEEVSEEELETAMREECPEVLEQIEEPPVGDDDLEVPDAEDGEPADEPAEDEPADDADGE